MFSQRLGLRIHMRNGSPKTRLKINEAVSDSHLSYDVATHSQVASRLSDLSAPRHPKEMRNRYRAKEWKVVVQCRETKFGF